MKDNPFDLSGKVALVSGGSSGIGLGMARALARAGADLCIWDLDEEKNASAKEELEKFGNKVVAAQCDVTSEDQVGARFAEAVRKLGRVDACFANAGVPGVVPHFHEMTIEEWRRLFATNMEGVFLTFREAVRQMLEQGDGGSLVGTSSLAAISGFAGGEHYAATKGGVVSLIKGLCVEYGKSGIRANAIMPGWIESGMTARIFQWDKFRARVMPRIPARRWGNGDDFGGIAVYLASDLSAYHSGDVFVIDGGYINF